MPAKKKRKLKRPRRQWTRSPVQRPHSTKRGKRGYARKRQSADLGDVTPAAPEPDP